MSHCCGGSTNNIEKEEIENDNLSEQPKSFIGKYLFKIGKKDFEKEKKGCGNKSGCC